MNSSTAGRGRLVVATGAIVLIVACFLQWWELSSGAGLPELKDIGISDGRVLLIFLAAAASLFMTAPAGRPAIACVHRSPPSVLRYTDEPVAPRMVCGFMAELANENTCWLMRGGVTGTRDHVDPPSTLRASPLLNDTDKRPGCASSPVANKDGDNCASPPLVELLTATVLAAPAAA